MIFPALLGIAGVAVLLSLGFWQLQRLEWKSELLARIDERLAAAPVAVPSAPAAEADQYRRVEATGTLLPGELHVYTSAPGQGVGYLVIAPMRLEDGRTLLVDRGFVPIDAKDAPRHLGPIRVQGSLLWPSETDSFTAAPDREKNIWFARDLGLMSEALGTAPLMIVISASDDPGAPLPMPVSVNIPNDHLGYAVTWFGLAAVWGVMTLALLWRIKRRID